MTAQANIVVDASVVLAVLRRERGGDKIPNRVLARAIISTVNFAEVLSKLIKDGNDPEEAWSDAVSVTARIEPYTEEQAKIAASLISTTRSFGLSLGDRSCLALAKVLKAEVYTADQIWRNLQVGIPIHILR